MLLLTIIYQYFMNASLIYYLSNGWMCHGLQVIAATNRADILDPALMRSGRLDRKIEFPHPSEEARARILQVCLLKSVLATCSKNC